MLIHVNSITPIGNTGQVAVEFPDGSIQMMTAKSIKVAKAAGLDVNIKREIDDIRTDIVSAIDNLFMASRSFDERMRSIIGEPISVGPSVNVQKVPSAAPVSRERQKADSRPQAAHTAELGPKADRSTPQGERPAGRRVDPETAPPYAAAPAPTYLNDKDNPEDAGLDPAYKTIMKELEEAEPKKSEHFSIDDPNAPRNDFAKEQVIAYDRIYKTNPAKRNVVASIFARRIFTDVWRWAEWINPEMRKHIIQLKNNDGLQTNAISPEHLEFMAGRPYGKHDAPDFPVGPRATLTHEQRAALESLPDEWIAPSIIEDPIARAEAYIGSGGGNIKK